MFGSEGGARKPTLEIGQGVGLLPYDTYTPWDAPQVRKLCGLMVKQSWEVGTVLESLKTPLNNPDEDQPTARWRKGGYIVAPHPKHLWVFHPLPRG